MRASLHSPVLLPCYMLAASPLEGCKDLRQGRRELESFFTRWYGPSRLTIAVVGDATAAQARSLTETPLLHQFALVPGPSALALDIM